MDSNGFFVQAFVYLAAALIVVPIATRLGLGSVLGYLVAGLAIGPSVPDTAWFPCAIWSAIEPRLTCLGG